MQSSSDPVRPEPDLEIESITARSDRRLHISAERTRHTGVLAIAIPNNVLRASSFHTAFNPSWLSTENDPFLPLYPCPVAASDPFAIRFDKAASLAQRSIRKYIQYNLAQRKQPWTFITGTGIKRRHATGGNPVKMVVVGFPPAGEEHKPAADIFVEEMAEWLTRAGLHDVGVLIIEASPAQPFIKNCTENEEWPFDETYCTDPVLGTSIGVRDQHEAGSLGLSARLTWPNGKDLIVGLTCRHVVNQTDEDTSSVAVDCPSKEDHQAALSCFDDLDGRFQIENNGLITKMEICPDELTTNQKRNYEARKKILELEHSCAESYRNADRYLGQVISHSNFGTREFDGQPRNMDWALISLSPRRFPMPGNNAVKDFKASGPPIALLQKMKLGYPMVPRQPYPLEKDKTKQVFKVGRTTGVTAGEVNNIDVTTTMKYRLVDHLGNKVTKTVVSTEKAVVVPKGSLGSFHMTPFSASGDSGAPVYNDVGRPVGMVIGGHRKQDPEDEDLPSLVQHFHYISSLREITADIQQVMTRPEDGGKPTVTYI